MSIKSISNRYDVAGLRDLLQTVQMSIKALERTGLPKGSIATFFFQKIKSSIPVETYREFEASERFARSDTLSSTEPSTVVTSEKLDRLLSFLQDSIDDLEDIDQERLQCFQSARNQHQLRQL